MKDRILAAINSRGIGVVLAFEGDPMCSCTEKDCRTYHGSRADFEIDHFGEWYLDNHFGLTDLPEKPGVYVWEGDIVYTGTGEDTDVIWRGKWEAATYADFKHFEVVVPSVTTADI